MIPEPKLGIIAGMEAELVALGRWRAHRRVVAGATGANPRRTGRAALRMWSEGCRMLISWGLAGGLDPELRPGDLILPDAVVTADGRAFALEAGRIEEGRAAEGAAPMRIAGSDRIVATPEDKAALAAATGAVAVDMETHLVARAALEAGFPALAIRAIADPAERGIPAVARDALDAEGRPRSLRVIGGLLADPRQIGPLLALRRDYRAGLEALAEAARTDLFERLIAATPRI